MQISSTRLGGNATGLPAVQAEPAPLPSLTAAFSRRVALFGAVSATGFLGAAAADAAGLLSSGAAPVLSTSDARLVVAADAYEGLQRRCDEHKAAHRGLPHDVQIAAEDEFDALTDGFLPLDAELARTPSDTMAGVVAKARACQVQTLRDYPGEVALSLADDVWRLFGGDAA